VKYLCFFFRQSMSRAATVIAALLPMQIAFAASVNPATINIFTETHREKPEWRWTPKLQFTIVGPVASGSTLSIVTIGADGKPWTRVECGAPVLAEGERERVNDCGERLDSRPSINQTGVFGFEIVLSNPLTGSATKLYAGKFKVGRYVYNPTRATDRNRQFYYTVDNDWRLSIGLMREMARDYHRTLAVDLWFKRTITDLSRFSAHLIYGGKEVANAGGSLIFTVNRHEANPAEFHGLTFNLPALFSAEHPENFRIHKLYENPGAYQLKVQRDGKLARTIDFSIGPDGRFAANGISVPAGIAANSLVVPVTISGDSDGVWNPSAWKTDMHWGNPIIGFTPR
jgi:hypothetical protein